MKCGTKLNHCYRLNLDIGVGHLVLIVKSLKVFCGYLEPERPGETYPQTMGLGVRVSIGLTDGLQREYGKSSGKCLKTM